MTTTTTTTTKVQPVDARALPARNMSYYPEVYARRVLPREKRAVGDAFGLTKIGMNHTTLMPGRESSMRHWHTHEDELVYVLEGELTLVSDDGEQVLTAGMAVGFKAGNANGHQFVNRSAAPVRYLEVSNRDPDDTAFYSDPDVDMAYHKDANGKGAFTHRDGTPW